jgi:hypothetical protein
MCLFCRTKKWKRERKNRERNGRRRTERVRRESWELLRRKEQDRRNKNK